MDLPNIQELQDKYTKIISENRRTLVRLRNSKLIIGVTDRLDAAISSLELVSKIFVDTLVGRLNAKKAAIFITDVKKGNSPYNRLQPEDAEDPIYHYLGKLTNSITNTDNDGKVFRCAYQVNLNISQKDFTFLPNLQWSSFFHH